MDPNLIYAKTPTGDEAVRQSTRVVQRNLRMVLVQVDGKVTVAELAEKVGNPKLVEIALQELEAGGYIAPVLEAASVWEESKRRAQQQVTAISPASQFSTFGPKSLQQSDFGAANRGVPSVFSTFGKPIAPSEEDIEPEVRPGIKDRLAAALEKRRETRENQEGRREPFISPRLRPLALVWGLLILLAVTLGGVFFYPYDNHKADLEAALGRGFVAPVHIGRIAFGLQPKPGLYLRDVRIGDREESRIAEIRLSSPWALFGTGRKTLNRVEMLGVQLSADRVAALASGGYDISRGDVGFILGEASLQQVSVVARDVVLGDLSGDISFKPGGGLDRLSLVSGDRSLRIAALPNAMGLGLTIEGLAWKPSAGKPFVFESMQAKALLQKGKMVVQDIDTTFMGGVMRGSWLLDWSSGLVMAGDASLARINSKLLLESFGIPLKLEGELSGGLRLRGAGGDWASLWANVEASMDAEIARGLLQGVDLGEASRRVSGGVPRTGSTKFDSLKGIFRLGPRQFLANELQLNAGLLGADGSLVVSRDGSGTVDGLFNVTLRSSVSAQRTVVRIGGQLSALTAVPVR